MTEKPSDGTNGTDRNQQQCESYLFRATHYLTGAGRKTGRTCEMATAFRNLPVSEAGIDAPALQTGFPQEPQNDPREGAGTKLSRMLANCCESTPAHSQRRNPPQGFSDKRYKEPLALKYRIDPDCSYIGESSAILQVFEAIDLRNKSPNRPVLLLGPYGAGKSEIAELIHKSSKRKNSPYERQQAAAFQTSDPSLSRSQWTGIGRGHALANVPSKGQPGLLEKCDGGTIFIDELCALSLDFQTLLLDVLDQKPVTRVGGAAISLKVNVRLIVATNADPSELVKHAKLRHDLLNRLDLHSAVRIPPLNQRKEDIFPFIRRWVGKRKVTRDFYLACLAYDWPGNVRELQQVVDHAIASAVEETQLTTDHLNYGPFQEILELLHLINEEDKELLLYKTLANTFCSQGCVINHGLHERIATLLGVSPSTVSRMAKKVRPDPR